MRHKKRRQKLIPLGERITDLRFERGLGLREFCRMTGLIPTTLDNIEGGITEPSIYKVAAIAQGFGITIDRLLEGCILNPPARRAAA